jgi:hypothetical protein
VVKKARMPDLDPQHWLLCSFFECHWAVTAVGILLLVHTYKKVTILAYFFVHSITVLMFFPSKITTDDSLCLFIAYHKSVEQGLIQFVSSLLSHSKM